MSLLEMHRISKEYPLGRQAVVALDGVSLHVERGEFTALVGPSGSGKSTLLNLVGCLDKPTSGTIRFDGTDITPVPLPRLTTHRRRRLGFVFQDFVLLPVLSAFENVEFPLLLDGARASSRRARVLELLDRVGLVDRADHRPDQLSGGERQRVAIARALVNDPELVLADEPTANLDSRTSAAILELLSALNEERGTTFLFATHDARIMAKARRRIALRDGRLEETEVELHAQA